MSPIHHFLLVFDRHRGVLLEQEDLGTDDAYALKIYEAKEAEHLPDRRIEVVVIGSDSIETVRRTHGNYFPDTFRPRSTYLVGL